MEFKDLKVTALAISFERKMDAGYEPYMRLMEDMRPNSPPFGTRKNGESIGLFVSAKIELGGLDAGEVISTAADYLKNKVDTKLMELYPDCFPIDEDVFVGKLDVTPLGDDDEF